MARMSPIREIPSDLSATKMYHEKMCNFANNVEARDSLRISKKDKRVCM
jgi:hypothetical protein